MSEDIDFQGDGYLDLTEELNALDRDGGSAVGKLDPAVGEAESVQKWFDSLKRFPCRARTIDEDHKAKSPLTAHGFKDATDDPSQLEAWTKQHAGCMWGAPTGAANGFWVFDGDVPKLDKKTGKMTADGRETIREFFQAHGLEFPPRTLTIKTPSDGFHYYFEKPESVEILTKAGILPGVDTRGDDGYVCIPPYTNLDNGKAYEIVLSVPPAETPAPLLNLVTKKKGKPASSANVAQVAGAIPDGGTAYGRKALADELARLRNTSEGKRNDTLNEVTIKLAGLAKGGELDGNEVHAAIEATARETGLSDSEIKKTMASAWKAATPRNVPARPGTKTAAMTAPEDGPIPLRKPPEQQQPYPVETFFEFSQTVADIARLADVPNSLAGSALDAAASLMSMPLVNVRTIKYRTPTAVFMMPLGKTGDGKGTTEEIAHKKIFEKQKKLQAEYHETEELHKAALAAFEREVLLLKKKKLDRDEYEKQYAQLLKTMPVIPVTPFLVVADANHEGIYKQLRYGLPYLGLFTEEGGRFFGGTAFDKENALKTISNMSAVWSGKTFDKLRSVEGGSALYNRRICASIMLQPELALPLLGNRQYTEQGFLCRFLFSWPEPVERQFLQIDPETVESIQKFYHACDELLSLPIRQDDLGGLIFDDLTLTPGANKAYLAYCRDMANNWKRGAKYELVDGYAKRSAENALRLGGSISMLRNPASRVIDVDGMDAGIVRARWHLDELLRIVSDEMTSPEIRQAEELLNWFWSKGITAASIKQVSHLGPNKFRTLGKKAIETAFSILEDHNWLIRIPAGALVWDGGEKQAKARTAWKVVYDIPSQN